jgi:hypothetical protein
MPVSLSSRRRFLGQAATVGLIGATWPAWAQDPTKSPPPKTQATVPIPANPAPPPAAAPPNAGAPPAGGDLPPPDSTAAAPEAAAESPAAAEPTAVTLPLAGPPRDRPLTKDFPQKGRMILQSTRPPVLETEMEVFDKNVITPNDRFYVEWHSGTVPAAFNTLFFRLTVRGNVLKPLSLSLADIKAM